MRKDGIVVLLKQHFLPCPLLALPLCSVMHLLWPTFALLCIEHVEIKGVLLLTLVVQKWGTEEVAAWLDLLHLGEYKDTFLRHDVGGAELLHLERRDLKVFLVCHLLLLEVSLGNRVRPPAPLLLLCLFCYGLTARLMLCKPAVIKYALSCGPNSSCAF